MDGEGIDPDALKSACDRHKPKAVYLVPTLHNPTTITLGPARRKAVCRHHPRRGNHPDRGRCLRIAGAVGIADCEPDPERSYLAVSLSKCIAPALRVSYLLVPDARSEQAMRSNLQATMQMPPPLMVALATHWLRSGIADQIVMAIRSEATGRQQLAAKILKGLAFAGKPGGHHLWLSLSSQWNRSDFVSHLLRDGLAVVGSEAFAVGEAAPHAVRVALGARAQPRRTVPGALCFRPPPLNLPPRRSRSFRNLFSFRRPPKNFHKASVLVRRSLAGCAALPRDSLAIPRTDLPAMPDSS